MPIENELKFCLLESPLIERVISDQAERAIRIEQKYLITDKGLSVRLRSMQEGVVTAYRMTVKQDVGKKVVEVETAISEDDFKRMWPIASNKVLKTRYIYQGWEVDFFKSKGVNYLAVAEIEMPENQTKPDFIPDLIKNYILYAVPREDRRFSNKKLGDVKYAVNLLKDVKRKQGVADVRIVEQCAKESTKKKFR